MPPILRTRRAASPAKSSSGPLDDYSDKNHRHEGAGAPRSLPARHPDARPGRPRPAAVGVPGLPLPLAPGGAGADAQRRRQPADLAVDTGLSKSAVQRGLRTLVRRRLLRVEKASRTAVPAYTVLRPWVAALTTPWLCGYHFGRWRSGVTARETRSRTSAAPARWTACTRWSSSTATAGRSACRAATATANTTTEAAPRREPRDRLAAPRGEASASSGGHAGGARAAPRAAPARDPFPLVSERERTAPPMSPESDRTSSCCCAASSGRKPG